MLVPKNISEEDSYETPPCNCNCYTKEPGLEKQNNTILYKLERLFNKPSNAIKGFISRHNSVESNGGDDSSSTSSVQSEDSINSDDYNLREKIGDTLVQVPAEFQVREFPASSLFSVTQNSSNQKSEEVHSLDCTSHSSSPNQSRNDRFYHVFKKGELESLVAESDSKLQVLECVYNSGHWCATITKDL